ncbi:MAG: hypothetical protein RR342_03770 [Bacilli bacterium]
MLNYNLDEAIVKFDSTHIRYMNVHPKQIETSDCVCRALSLATDTPYLEMRKKLNKIKREGEHPSYTYSKFIEYFMDNILECKKESYPAVKGSPRMNGELFAQLYPVGIYVLRMAHHLTCCINGVIYDTWDCRDRCVYSSYKIGE